MAVKNDREYRDMTMEIRSAENEDVEQEERKVVKGYASTFNEPYTLYENDDWRFDEVVDARAFDNTDMSDVIMQYDHEGRVFARMSNNTLTVTPDEKGLLIEADLGGTELGRQLFEEIRDMKDADGKDLTVRTITSVRKLYDVSAVSLPANDATSISVRTLTDGEIERIQAERLEAEALELRRRKLLARAKLNGGQ